MSTSTITAHVFIRCRAILGSRRIAGNMPCSAEVFATNDFGGFVMGQAALLAGRLFLKIRTEDSD